MELKQRKKLLLGIGIYAVIFLILLWATNVAAFNQWLSSLLILLRPLLIGLVFAYICNPFFRFFERKLLYKIHPHGLRRALSLLLSYLVLVLILVLLLLLIFPQLFESILNFIENADGYFDSAITDVNNIIDWLNGRLPHGENQQGLIPHLNPQMIKNAFAKFTASLKLDSATLLNFLNADTIGKLIALAGDVLTLITDIIFGLFISIYLLNSKEKRYAQIMRYRHAFFSDRTNAMITKICSTADRSFGGFLKGKILDSAIIGVLVYIAISIFGIPYAILIAVTVAITDIVPIIGPFIGVIPSAVIILLTDPPKVIPFLICILVIQQFDGNVLAPKVLGENTGVSSLCVLVAITTMGALWGLVGMIIGVPLFATVLELTNEYLEKKLKQKGLSTATDDYYTPELAGEQPISEPEAAPQSEPAPAPFTLTLDGSVGDLSEQERAALNGYRTAKKNRLFSKSPQQLRENAKKNDESKE